MSRCFFCQKPLEKKNSKRKFCSVACSNRFNKNGLKKVTLPQKSPELAEFVGILLGDGDLTRYQVKVTLNAIADAEYIHVVKRMIERLFPELQVFAMKRKKVCAIVVGVSSATVCRFFHEMGIVSRKPKIPEWIFDDKRFIISCIRGLVDTGGCVSFKMYSGKRKRSVYRQLTFTSLNNVLLQFMRDNLRMLGFHCTGSLIKNIYLSNDREIDKYRSLIEFHNPKLEHKSLMRDYESYVAGRDAGAVDQASLEN